ncbi:MAG: S8 family peptidase [Prevotellaceae bacterium]|nr:S8 family peptidase [Candidatus Colivivens equi]
MSDHAHISLHDLAESIEFIGQRGGGNKIFPIEDPLSHSSNLRSEYELAISTIKETALAILPQDLNAQNGTYVDVKMDQDSPIGSWKQLDTKKGVRLMNVRQQEGDKNVSVATIFIPEDKEEWLNGKLDEYEVEPEINKNRKSSVVIDAMKGVDVTTLSSFFECEEEYKRVTNHTSEYELWLPSDVDINEAKSAMSKLNIVVGNDVIAFEDINVVLIKATKIQLERLIHVIKPIYEIRHYHCPSVLTGASFSDDRQWVDLIKNDIVKAKGNLSRIGILDTGVNNKHPLLSSFLPDDRCVTVKKAELGLKDKANHGTLSAGLAIYGDLSDVINLPSKLLITNELASVKMFHDNNTSENEQEHKAIVTLHAIDCSSHMGADIMVSSVTAEDSLRGIASATSAAIDKKLYESEGKQLLMLSAGNRRNDKGIEYPSFIDNETIQDPAQAWNVITIGAMTKKVAVKDPEMKGVRIVAPAGGPSPITTSSSLWGDSNAIKPEIVMEGGNAYWSSGNEFAYHSDLDLVSTNAKILERNFGYFNATSAAVAMAAKLAGEIKYHNQNLSALSIRALMVHSAEWTDTMKQLYKNDNGDLDKDALMHVCGYGTPNRNKAILSSDSNVTFVNEEIIRPYTLKDKASELSFAQMHLYKLPWPKEVLSGLGDKIVRLKITLSYYVEPSPGEREILNKYKYASTGLRFDVNCPTETEEQFKARVSHVIQDDVRTLKNDSSRWGIGIQRRNHGSIHSDYIEDTASNISECNMIAVYPATGWWKSRKNKKDAEINYSLVVSLEAPETDIYTSVMQKIEITI